MNLITKSMFENVQFGIIFNSKLVKNSKLIGTSKVEILIFTYIFILPSQILFRISKIKWSWFSQKYFDPGTRRSNFPKYLF